MAQVKRVHKSITYLPEKKILDFTSQKIFKFISANQLTFLAFLGSLLISYTYIYLAPSDINYLHLASLGMFLHWFGDSLDGRVARLRGVARPNWGHYMDHLIDAINITIIFLGMHFSPLTLTSLAIYALIAALMLDIHNHLKTAVTKTFNLDLAGIGGTEIRMIFIAFNTLIIVMNNKVFELFGYLLTLTDILALFAIAFSILLFTLKTSSSLWGKNKIQG